MISLPWPYVVAACVLSSGLANRSADQATLRDCAAKGSAEMVGGGAIKCEVVFYTTRIEVPKP